MKRGAMSKKGQVTIFIIIGIIIVALGVLIYSFYPQIKSALGGEEKNPPAYIQACIEDEITDAVDKLSLQGGSLNPESYIMFDDSKVEYLCYTADYYANCIVQQPLLKKHIESEIKTDIQSKVENCFNMMKESYEKKGYTADLKTGEERVELLPKRVAATFNYSLTLTKGDTQKYDSFVVAVSNNLYELVAIATSIIEWETTLGDADVANLMTYYHNLKVEKNLRESGEKIYVLTDRNTGDKFQFAVRSQAWPAGYAKPII
jgi:hypothetical protein